MSFEDWAAFSKFLKKLSNKEGRKGGNNSSPLISPAVYLENSTRSNKNVTRWASWAAVDVDDFSIHTGDINNNIQRICGRYSFVCYSTASSTAIQPKFRLVFPLRRDVQANEIGHFWYALNQKLESIGDKQTKDRSRMYYVPAQYPDAFNFFFENEGEIMDPDTLMQEYSYNPPTGNSFLDRLPPELAKAVIDYRKSKMTETAINWSDYKDCPFFPRQLSMEYQTISGTGWYHKMYQIMVAIAANAIKREYPITSNQIAELCRQFDKDTGNWYDNRPLEVEADRAIEYAYRNV